MTTPSGFFVTNRCECGGKFTCISTFSGGDTHGAGFRCADCGASYRVGYDKDGPLERVVKPGPLGWRPPPKEGRDAA